MINFHPDTARILSGYIRDVRNPIIRRGKKKNPKVKVPEDLFIYEQAGKLKP